MKILGYWIIKEKKPQGKVGGIVRCGYCRGFMLVDDISFKWWHGKCYKEMRRPIEPARATCHSSNYERPRACIGYPR